MSWVFDITPEGIQKTKPITQVKSEKKQVASKGWKITSFVSIIIIIAFVGFYIIRNMKQSSDIAKLEKSIAVLPFDNMSDDEEFAHLGGAFTDEIILELQKIHKFDRVLSRTSTMQYKDNRPTIPEIAAKLGVNYIIEGSIQRHNEAVSIRVQVIRAKHEDHVWADEYTGKWDDIFNIQDNIAKQVAKELNAVLSPEEIRKIEKVPTNNREAYNLYLKGRYYWNKRTRDGLEKSIIYFKKAINIDTAYALAYTGLAESYVVLGEYQYYSPGEVFENAKNAALKAIKIDNNIAEAHNVLAAIKRDYEWDWPGAEKEYLKAIELNPEYPTAYQWYSEYLSIMGRHNEAIEKIIYAQELDPLSPIIYAVGGNITYFYARQYNKAISQCRRALEIDSNFVVAHYALVAIYIKLMMFDEATNEAKKAVFLSNGDLKYTAELAKVYALTGYRNEAIKILNDLIERSKQIYYSPGRIAEIYLALDMKNQALDWLEKGFTDHDYYLVHIKMSPKFDELRSEPGFIVLLKKMGFE